MSRLNTQKRMKTVYTHEGAPVKEANAKTQLERAVMSCMLWEDTFYESGQSIADRITNLATQVRPERVADIAIKARKDRNLRHVPLLLVDSLTKTGAGSSLVSDTIQEVICRPDELTEMLAIYWRNGKHPLSNQLKKGLAKAFRKFDAYQLAKYDRQTEVKLRDVLFLTHPKPKNDTQAQDWKKLVEGTLESPDTWESNAAAGNDPKETFTRLMSENKLGYMALLRNLRKMQELGVDRGLIKSSIVARRGAGRVLPFRFVAAAKHAPSFEKEIDAALVANIEELPPLPGRTIVLVDVSGSMDWGKVSAKSELTRREAGAVLASMVTGDDVRVFTFANSVKEIPYRIGMAGVDAIMRSPSGGTNLGSAIRSMNKVGYDNLIVITDEQSHDAVGSPLKGSNAFMINVASYRNGIDYDSWVKINGFSESVLTYIYEYIKEFGNA